MCIERIRHGGGSAVSAVLGAAHLSWVRLTAAGPAHGPTYTEGVIRLSTYGTVVLPSQWLHSVLATHCGQLGYSKADVTFNTFCAVVWCLQLMNTWACSRKQETAMAKFST
eukprot:GHRR01013410.1.p3 GENE.GHRR01013410.1~~GHRR01013410.1.p3  ORF type:complete len:111 (+),score=21.43 GHRR01013410.1:2949-3281(+)